MLIAPLNPRAPYYPEDSDALELLGEWLDATGLAFQCDGLDGLRVAMKARAKKAPGERLFWARILGAPDDVLAEAVSLAVGRDMFGHVSPDPFAEEWEWEHTPDDESDGWLHIDAEEVDAEEAERAASYHPTERRSWFGGDC